MEMKGLKENKQDEKGKLESSKLAQNRPSEPNLAQASPILPRRDHFREVGLFLVQLAQASPDLSKREVT